MLANTSTSPPSGGRRRRPRTGLSTIDFALACSFYLVVLAAAAENGQKRTEPKTEDGTNGDHILPEDAKFLEEAFVKLDKADDSKSLLKKYLSKEVFEEIKDKKTERFGSNLRDVIQSGVKNLDCKIGVYAPDVGAYKTFAALFDPIIEDYHGGFSSQDKHPDSDFGNPEDFGNLDPEGQFVVSTRIRCGRSLSKYPLNPNMKEEDYINLEKDVSETLEGLGGNLKGKYLPLSKMSQSEQQDLIDQHFLFKEGDRFLEAANAIRFWPTGRGIFFNEDRNFLVWCGEEDHLRIISMQQGGHVGEVYGRLVTAIHTLSSRLDFSHDDRLGFLTLCPTNLGTTIRASVHIKLPRLAEGGHDALQAVADKYQLQVRGSAGEDSEAKDGLYDISNLERMGLTEYEAVKKMYDGVKELIRMEKDKMADADAEDNGEDILKEEDEENMANHNEL